jgi:ATP-dependent Clp protease adaptor protein ClpS
MTNKQDDQSVAVAEPQAKTKPSTRPQPRTMPLFNVVLLDDNDHSYDYVIEMLGRVFTHPVQRAFQMAKEVDKAGRVIVMTTHKELAELKRDQILGYGADPRLSRSRGSMSAVIEPAEL